MGTFKRKKIIVPLFYFIAPAHYSTYHYIGYMHITEKKAGFYFPLGLF